MALVVITDLPSIVPVRDPQWYEVYCGRYRKAEGRRTIYAISVHTNPAPGQTFTIAVGPYVLEFAWVIGVAGDSGLEVGIGDDTTETTMRLYSALIGNYQLSELFLITQEAGQVVLTSHQNTGIPAIFIDTDPGTMTFLEEQEGMPDVYMANYKAMYRPLVETAFNNGDFRPLPVQLGDPDPIRHARWPVQKMLAPSVRPVWPPYEVPSHLLQPTVCDLLTARFVLQRWEQYGEPPYPNRVYQSDVKTAWYAGSRNNEHHRMQDMFILMRRTDMLNPWLTYRGRGGRHEVSPEQRHYLSYYRRTERDLDNYMRLQCTVYYADGTEESVNKLSDQMVQWDRGQVATWPTGFTQLGLHTLHPTRTPTHYTIRIGQHPSNSLSETHTFHLVLPDANDLHICWVNSLGVVESMLCSGQWKTGLEVDSELVERLLHPVNNAWPHEEEAGRRTVLNKVDQHLEVSTGYMDRVELEACMDMLFSPAWRLDDPVRKTRHPLNLEAAQHVMKTQGDPHTEHLYAMNLRFTVGDAETAWSMRHLLPNKPDYPDPGDGGPVIVDPDEPVIDM